MNEEIKSALLRVLPFVIALMALGIATRKGRIDALAIDLRRPAWARFAAWVGGFIIFVLLIEVVWYRMGMLEVTPWNHPFAASVIRITGAVILAPITEEIIFRGLLLNVLTTRKVNMHLAIVIQACFFVLLHNFTWQNTLSSNIGIVQGFTDACLFGYARYHSRSLYTPMAMHISGNLVATLERFIL